MFQNGKCLSLLFIAVIVFTSFTACSLGNEDSKSVELQEHKEAWDTAISFKDLADREIILEAPAKRIFLGFYAENFLAVNENFENVVCISKAEWADFFNGQYNAYEKNIPELAHIINTGSIYNGSFSMETALSVAPDVAILAPFQYRILGENVKKLETAGTKVVVIDYNSQEVHKHILSTQILGMITGKEERAKALADEYAAAVEDVQRRVSGLKNEEKKRVYVELGNLGPSEYGNSYGEHMWGNLITMAGGKNIAFGKVESYGSLSPEHILSSDPEVIFLVGSNWVNDGGNRVKIGFGIDRKETIERMRPYIQRPGWKRLSAIKKGEIYAVDHGGLRTIYDYTYLQFIGKVLYPELFEDISPEQNLISFYERYMPISLEGCFMTKYQD
ncbi:ABC-type Fe3+-hydroxamate transport system, periplasmic component [Clostridium aceticum]|uniref:ABC-type Fe3+-hydroxamate transport system, periplasmic component n=1 Tax=Clostridium aceticum TaxID=84022 RepID=A0A0G3WFC1_9CLOT|nr:ABC transporter substrate-binding protein [Clostridium aceticum]AKL96560.1 ABC-type Fe3+-hydroxamate transport system, periplasmic component [Clostridium aceticum]